MEIAPTLHRVGNDIVAAYLYTTSAGVTVIDAGLPGMWTDLLAELEAMHRTVDDIKGVILTHGDSDHVGFAERLHREHGVPIYIHAADAARAKGGPKPKNAKQDMRLGATLGFIAHTARKGGFRTRWLSDVVEITGGQRLDLPGVPEIIALPGHSAGSVAVSVPDLHAVFVGDALTTRNVLTGQRGPAPAPFTDNPDQAIASLRALLETDAQWVLPGHGAPWGDGIAAAVEAVGTAARAAA